MSDKAKEVQKTKQDAGDKDVQRTGDGATHVASETHAEGLGKGRNEKSTQDSASLAKQGTIGNLTIENNGSGKQSSTDVLKNPNASAEDKIRAAHEMSKNGQNSFSADGRSFEIQSHDYGKRSSVVVSTKDSHGNYSPVLRGLVEKDGTVKHQHDAANRETSFKGSKAEKELSDNSVAKTNQQNGKAAAAGQETKTEHDDAKTGPAQKNDSASKNDQATKSDGASKTDPAQKNDSASKNDQATKSDGASKTDPAPQKNDASLVPGKNSGEKQTSGAYNMDQQSKAHEEQKQKNESGGKSADASEQEQGKSTKNDAALVPGKNSGEKQTTGAYNMDQQSQAHQAVKAAADQSKIGGNDGGVQQGAQKKGEQAKPWNIGATNLDGKHCKAGDEGQVPNLRPSKDMGCHFDSNFGVKDIPGEQIKDNLDTLARIHTPIKAGKIKDDQRGSGVIIGHNNDVTYVATVQHNFTTYENNKEAIDSRTGKPILKDGPSTVEMPDGKRYEARQIKMPGEKDTDRAVLAVHTGADTGKYHEAKIAESSKYEGPGYALGFPGETKSPYVSPLQSQGKFEHKGKDYDGDQDAPSVLAANKGRSEEGMSGGPMFNQNGEVYGLDQSNDGTAKKAYGAPIDKETVERWKKHLPANW